MELQNIASFSVDATRRLTPTSEPLMTATERFTPSTEGHGSTPRRPIQLAVSLPLTTATTARSPHALATPSSMCVSADAGNVSTLQINADLLALRNIDTAAQVFDCTLMLQIKWHEMTAVDGSGDGTASWEPDIAFTNTVDDLRIQLRETRRSKPIAGGRIVQIIHVMVVSGTFAEHYELRQFPMDCQRLHIKAVLLNCPAARNVNPHASMDRDRSSNTSSWYSRRFRLTGGVVSMQEDSFMDTDSWHIIESLDISSGRSDRTPDAEAISYCTFTVHLTVERLCTYYFWNIVFPISLEGVMALFTCFLDAEDISTKTQITITIILTIFAVKFASTQYLPPVNCNTYMDRYFILSTLMMCMIMAQNLAVYKLIEPDSGSTATADAANYVSGVLLASLWCALHALLYPVFLLPWVRARCVRREIDQKDNLLEREDASQHDKAATAAAAAGDDGGLHVTADDAHASSRDEAHNNPLFTPFRGQPSTWSLA